MLDRIVKVDDTRVVLVFTDRPAFTVSTDEGNVMEFLQWFLSPSKKGLTEYTEAFNNEQEITKKIVIAA